jgi:hypothetical protein
LHALEGVYFGLNQSDGGETEVFKGKWCGDESEQTERVSRRYFVEIFYQGLYAGGNGFVVGVRRNTLLVKGENLRGVWLVNEG